MPTHHEGPLPEKRALDAYITLMRAADSVTARTTAPMTEHGLTVSQFGVLEALLHLGPLAPGALAAKLLKTGGNITFVVKNLERRGLVSRRRSGDDRRSFTISLTAKGEKLVRAVFPRVLERIVAELGALSAAEQTELRRLCRKVGLGEYTSSLKHSSLRGGAP